jgi:GT2 family glycosyltransferase
MIVSNPDVTFGANAIDLLSDALHDAAAAGPALFWDDAHTWMLPPGDLDTAWQRVDAMLASRSRAWFVQRDRRRFLRRVAFWSLQERAQTNMLSGAVLALRLDAFDALGGFDERFPLYFEETDFLRRLTQARKRIVYVPQARCRHLYNQSAAQVAIEAAARYAQSEMRYLEKWNGPFVARTLKRLEKPMHVESPPTLQGALQCERDDLVIEASPLPTFATAAGHFPRQRSVTLPAEVQASMRAPFYVRAVVRATGEVLATYTIAP